MFTRNVSALCTTMPKQYQTANSHTSKRTSLQSFWGVWMSVGGCFDITRRLCPETCLLSATPCPNMIRWPRNLQTSEEFIAITSSFCAWRMDQLRGIEISVGECFDLNGRCWFRNVSALCTTYSHPQSDVSPQFDDPPRSIRRFSFPIR
jgi:hypothetical protein